REDIAISLIPSTKALIPIPEPPPEREIFRPGLRFRNASTAFSATGSSVVEPLMIIWVEGAGVDGGETLAASPPPQPLDSAVIVDKAISTNNFLICFTYSRCSIHKR